MKASLQNNQELIEYIWGGDGLVEIHMYDLSRDFNAFSIEAKNSDIARQHWYRHVLLGFKRNH